MSSFGCKQPLKEAIITEDVWFNKAEAMCKCMIEHFKEYPAKQYHLINAEAAAKERKKKKKEDKIEKCGSYHVISVNQGWKFSMIKYLRDINIVEKLKLNNLINEIDIEVEDDADKDDAVEDEDAEKVDQSWRLSVDVVFELIEPGTFVGVRRPSNVCF